jgi:cell wall-associated NlpC family hydrolase
MTRWNFAVAAMLAMLLGGCAGAPESPDQINIRANDEVAAKAVAFAHEMLGKPYLYAGDTPTGFDCSGLVKYSYGRAGIALPRDTQSQRRLSVPVSVRSMRNGDLLFFDQEGKKNSHVGLYIGKGRFIHAPSSGGKVRTDSLEAQFWKKHFVEARRI